LQWRAEGPGCPGPTRFLDVRKTFRGDLRKYFYIRVKIKSEDLF